jgi:hypothetical protein
MVDWLRAELRQLVKADDTTQGPVASNVVARRSHATVPTVHFANVRSVLLCQSTLGNATTGSHGLC